MIAQSFHSSAFGGWLKRFAWPIVWLTVILLHVGAVAVIFWSVESREDLVILRYNAYLGINLLGVWWQLFLMPAITFVFTLLNFLLAKLLFGRGYPGVAALFLIGSVLLSLAMVVVAATLSFINI
ncbi:hypothetical protein E6Q11_06325 [Candidatus Dojkabacteria bacterium]|uniref:Uncharacterized protein n=1 Tax=Candidatus Dojkabacteria bacterium TaxID=2099670 RepID=A0A5C7J2V1_9BACT|nr:MAG: hypothetical protein E6Q11_06325 [Candidatus Dojkabacteria bacterium]